MNRRPRPGPYGWRMLALLCGAGGWSRDTPAGERCCRSRCWHGAVNFNDSHRPERPSSENVRLAARYKISHVPGRPPGLADVRAGGPSRSQVRQHLERPYRRRSRTCGDPIRMSRRRFGTQRVAGGISIIRCVADRSNSPASADPRADWQALSGPEWAPVRRSDFDPAASTFRNSSPPGRRLPIIRALCKANRWASELPSAAERPPAAVFVGSWASALGKAGRPRMMAGSSGHSKRVTP
jgi:hypothetical protein